MILFACLALICLSYRFGGKVPRFYRARSCQGRGWKREFPTIPKKEIRKFLLLFVDAFAFNERQKLLFSPGDSIFSVYRSIYPNRWTPDSLELETLVHDIKKEYAINLEDYWNENLTLGELFALINEKRAGLN